MTSESGVEMEDPLDEDNDSPLGLTHRYPDRVLMVATHLSTMYGILPVWRGGRKAGHMELTGSGVGAKIEQHEIRH